MAEYLIQDTTLDAIADAINAKTGGSSAMTPAEMVTAIGSISGGGGDPQVRNWKIVYGTVTQTSKSSTVSFNTGINSGTLVSFIASLADGIENLPEFTEGVTSQIIGHTFRAGTAVLPGSETSQLSLVRTNTGSNTDYVAGANATLSASGTISFGNNRGSYSLPNTIYKYVAVIEVTTQ